MKDADLQMMRLLEGYLVRLGWDRSRSEGPVDATGAPIPWITYPAIEVLAQVVKPDFRIFEFGSGNSSLWWAARCEKVVSVDHDERWIDSINLRRPENLTLIHRPRYDIPSTPPSPEIAAAISKMIREQILSEKEGDNEVHGLNIHDFVGYAMALMEWPQAYFDIIVVDGMARSLCAYLAGLWVKPNGLIVFDNSDRGHYSIGYEALRELGFGRIDFFGPCPINTNESCTSLFAQQMKLFLDVPKRDRLTHL